MVLCFNHMRQARDSDTLLQASVLVGFLDGHPPAVDAKCGGRTPGDERNTLTVVNIAAPGR